ncbi:MAG: DUF4159 domain-containing protein [Verrucomicrobiales bacterium]
MERSRIRQCGTALFVIAGTLLVTAQDSREPVQPTYFGIEDGEVPEDPRHWRGGGHYDFPDWQVNRELPNDVFTFARLRYNSGTWMGRRAKWMIDYPDSELNFSYRLQQLTSLEVDPKGVIVDIDAEQLRHYPFVYMIEPGDIWITDEEATILREYMLNGGFIMVDDFWGAYEWKNFYRAVKQIFPDRDYVELELDHPIFHLVFDLDMKPQIPAVGMAMMGREQGITYEWNKPGSETPHYRAIMDDDGRICMMICFNTDLGDGWEEEGTDPWYFREFSEKYAYPLGINIVFYALTH